MGQYYNPCILTENKRQVKSWVYSHKYGSGLKLMEHSYLNVNFIKAFESLILDTPKIVVWCGDYADEVKGCKTNLYDRCNDKNEVTPTPLNEEINYVINHTKKQFVDVTKTPKDSDGWQIHPLPLLTCYGNGRGGGDFFINPKKEQGNVELIGSWAFDLISVSRKKPKDFTELVFDLIER